MARQDLNLKKAGCVKKNSPVDCFLADWCAVGYRMPQALGRQAGQIAKQYAVLLPAPRNPDILHGYLDFLHL